MSFWQRVKARWARDVIAEQIAAVEVRLHAEADSRVQEAMSAGRRDDEKLLEQGFRPVGPSRLSQSKRELPALAQDRMLQVVYFLWRSNPLAQWIVETTVDFVLGEGATVVSEVPEIQDVIDAHWNDPVNKLERRLETFIFEYGLYGELCLPVFVNEADGHVRYSYIDPLDIAEVITSPHNVLETIAVVLKGTGGARQRVYKVVREETSRASSYYGQMIPNLPLERDPVLGVPYDGACLFWQTNKVSNARRGASDLLSLIDWLDGYDAFLFDSMDGAQSFNSFFWDVELKGKDEAGIRAWLAENGGRMQRGMIRAHNEHVKWSEVTPDLKAIDKDQFARLYRGHILGSRSYPEHWYGLAGEVNLASAKEMGLPPVKRLTRRQKHVRGIISDMIRFQLHQAIRVGRLRKDVVIGRVDAEGSSQAVTKRTDQAFRIDLPELSMRDHSSIVAAIAGLTASLLQAQTQGWIRPETAARLFIAQASALGYEINATDELASMAAFVPGSQDYQAFERIAQKTGISVERLLAMLERLGQGNGDNPLDPKKEPAGAAA